MLRDDLSRISCVGVTVLEVMASTDVMTMEDCHVSIDSAYATTAPSNILLETYKIYHIVC